MRKINIRKSYPPIIKKKKRQGISEKYHVVKIYSEKISIPKMAGKF